MPGPSRHSRKYIHLSNFLAPFLRDKVVHYIYTTEAQNIVEMLLIRTNWFWFQEIYPYAFTQGAHKTRGYVSRKPAYVKRKLRILFSRGKYDPRPKDRGPLHPPPLYDAVWTGNFKRMTLTAPKKNPYMKVKGRGGVFSCGIQVEAPIYVRYSRSRIKVLKEVTRITKKDQEQMTKFFAKRVVPALKQYLVSKLR